MSTKLHEILAVESTKEKAASKLLSESIKTLNKESLFKGQTRVLKMFKEEDKQSETTDHQELTSTVDENLDYLVGPFSDWLDVVLAKEDGNQTARADVEIDGKVLIEAVPATFLLGLEKKLVQLRSLYDVIPTLPPGVKWIKDEQDRDGVFICPDTEIQMKTQKDVEFKIAYEATDKHPAQVVQVERTINIGRYETTKKCGMMTPLEKANRLSRIDKLLAAVKKARMRANNVEISTKQHCKVLFDYINKGS